MPGSQGFHLQGHWYGSCLAQACGSAEFLAGLHQVVAQDQLLVLGHNRFWAVI